MAIGVVVDVAVGPNAEGAGLSAVDAAGRGALGRWGVVGPLRLQAGTNRGELSGVLLPARESLVVARGE